MNLQLVKMEPQYRSLAEDMIREWKTSGEAIVPWAIDRADIRDFSAYMDSLEQTGTADGLVPESTFSAWIQTEILWWEPSIYAIISMTIY